MSTKTPKSRALQPSAAAVTAGRRDIAASASSKETPTIRGSDDEDDNIDIRLSLSQKSIIIVATAQNLKQNSNDSSNYLSTSSSYDDDHHPHLVIH